MNPLRVYIDTSVFGGYFDEEFAAGTKPFFELIQTGAILPLLSETLVQELVTAPERVQNLFDLVRKSKHETLSIDREALALQQAYLRAEIVTAKYAEDALHVAQATLARADVIASWNFHHLVNPTKMRAFSGINITMGYGLVVIMTPSEIGGILEGNHE